MTTKKADIYSIPNLVTHLTMINLANEVQDLQQKQKQICEMAARSILQALDCKDHYTFGHSARVAYYCLQVGQELGLNKEELYDLELSALFHDIGKIGVPDAVLLKPSRLTEEEFKIMKSHPEKSAEILQGFEAFEKIATYAKHHHERFDGRGYPYCLKGEDIPFYSRILLISDTFDAMTSSRPYRKGLSYETAYEELEEFAGSQFDPYLVKNFIQAMEKDKARQEETFKLKIIDGLFKKEAA